MRSSSDASAFRALEHALFRRRLRGLDPRLRAEMTALALLLAAFCFWQIRVPLDGAARREGPLMTAGIALALLALFAAVAGIVTGVRHAHTLLRGPAGPEWLSLPIDPVRLHRHLAWNARGPALLAALPAAATLMALTGLVPPWWNALLAAVFAWMLLEATRAGGALAFHLVRSRAPSAHGVAPLAAVLAMANRAAAKPARPAARWRRASAWRALLGVDLALSTAPTAARTRAALVGFLLLLSIAAWLVPAPLALRRAGAFALSLLAASAAAEWIIEVTCLHPFAVLRSLPLGVASVWGSRCVLGAGVAAALLAAQATAARDLAPAAARVHLAWLGGAALAIGLLGANYAVTLYPRGGPAMRMLTLSLTLAVVASFMIPLAGWVLVLTAVLHSALRLPRWTRVENA